MRFPSAVILGLVCLATLRSEAAPLTNCLEIAGLPDLAREDLRPVDFVAQVQAHHPAQTEKDLNHVFVSDGQAGIGLHWLTNMPFALGDTLRIRGNVQFYPNVGNLVVPSDLRILSHGTPFAPESVTLRQIQGTRFRCRRVIATGTVIDAFCDEIDPRNIWLILSDGQNTVSAAVPSANLSRNALPQVIGRRVTVRGLCSPYHPGRRRFVDSWISVRNTDSISFGEEDRSDPFAAPSLTDSLPQQTFQRRRLDGLVIATWDRRRMFVCSANGELTEVDLMADKTLPRVGDRIRATGFALTDPFFIRLVQSDWRHEDLPDAPRLFAEDAAPRDFLVDNTNDIKFEPKFNGRLKRLTGTVRGVPNRATGQPFLHIDCDGYLIPVNVSALAEDVDGLVQGARVAVTGACLMELDDRDAVPGFPRIRGFTLIVRDRADIEILATPSWWTPLRLLAVIAVLLLVIAVIIVWNVSLRILAERRGRALFRENVARIGANLRTEERTRLAVELHDSLSQMLTGISLQVEAGETAVAARSLESCRQELRNCLWDLRNETLDDADLNTAIRRTLEPHLGGARLAVRFNVPRAKLSDSTAHAILMIVRELAANAVRHGRARTIRVAGSLDGDALMLSVQDDGCGFDPENRPGLEEGHYGLQGVWERVNRHNGTLRIDSAPGKGTYVSITLGR